MENNYFVGPTKNNHGSSLIVPILIIIIILVLAYWLYSTKKNKDVVPIDNSSVTNIESSIPTENTSQNANTGIYDK